ncbi:MAG: molybdopterin-binding protein, partial [Alphaproteobacteria bacterium]|nr:molybdopterin-binding protein [Alphaproteobacteria bacterium]
MSKIDPNEQRDFIPVNIAVLTVSDSRTLDDDRSGGVLVERLGKAGHNLADRAIVSDDEDKIVERLQGWIADPSIQVVIATGG